MVSAESPPLDAIASEEEERKERRRKNQVVEMRMRMKEEAAAIEANEEDGDQEEEKMRILIGCKYVFYMMNFICTSRFFGLCQWVSP